MSSPESDMLSLRPADLGPLLVVAGQDRMLPMLGMGMFTVGRPVKLWVGDADRSASRRSSWAPMRRRSGTKGEDTLALNGRPGVLRLGEWCGEPTPVPWCT